MRRNAGALLLFFQLWSLCLAYERGKESTGWKGTVADFLAARGQSRDGSDVAGHINGNGGVEELTTTSRRLQTDGISHLRSKAIVQPKAIPATLSYDQHGRRLACCGDGYYSTGVFSCQKCPLGWSNHAACSINLEATTDCQPCRPGTYCSSEGCTTCASCEKGHFAPDFYYDECLACPSGSYQAGTAGSSCDDCKAGSYTDKTTGATSCTSCPAGSISVSGATSCTLCPAGMSSNRGSAECFSCPEQTSNPVAGGVCLGPFPYECESGTSQYSTSITSIRVSSGDALDRIEYFTCGPFKTVHIDKGGTGGTSATMEGTAPYSGFVIGTWEANANGAAGFILRMSDGTYTGPVYGTKYSVTREKVCTGGQLLGGIAVEALAAGVVNSNLYPICIPQTYRCPYATVIMSVHVMSGDYIDQIVSFLCSDGSTVSVSVGGDGGAPLEVSDGPFSGFGVYTAAPAASGLSFKRKSDNAYGTVFGTVGGSITEQSCGSSQMLTGMVVAQVFTASGSHFVRGGGSLLAVCGCDRSSNHCYEQGQDCTCASCVPNYTLDWNSNPPQCCPTIQYCIDYDDSTCKCKTCNSTSLTPVNDGTVCGVCYGVANCTKYGVATASSPCYCIQCASPYTSLVTDPGTKYKYCATPAVTYQCPPPSVITSITLKSAIALNQITSFVCSDSSLTVVPVGVGGSGGQTVTITGGPFIGIQTATYVINDSPVSSSASGFGIINVSGSNGVRYGTSINYSSSKYCEGSLQLSGLTLSAATYQGSDFVAVDMSPVCVCPNIIPQCVTYSSSCASCSVCATGSTLVNGACIRCDANFYLSTAGCTTCDPGTTSPAGSTSIDACTKSGVISCPPGSIISAISLRAGSSIDYFKSITCTDGNTYYARVGNSSGGGPATATGPFTSYTSGIWDDGTGSTVGLYFSYFTVNTATYGNAGAVDVSTKSCESGKFLSGLDVTGLGTDYGTLVLLGSSAICSPPPAPTPGPTSPCPVGTYIASLGCVPCDLGSYNASPGASSCTLCPIGSFAGSVNSVACTQCAVGSFSGTTGAAACSPCQANTYGATTGLSSCTSCDAGYNSPAGSTSVDNCYKSGVTSCPTGFIISAISLRSGSGIDYVRSITCTNGVTYYIRAGNSSGGTPATITGSFTGYTSGAWDNDTGATAGLFFTLSVGGKTATYGSASTIEVSTKNCGGGQWLSGLNVIPIEGNTLILLGSSPICSGTAAPTATPTTPAPTATPTLIPTPAPTAAPTTAVPTASPTVAVPVLKNCPTGHIVSDVSLRSAGGLNYFKSITCTDGVEYFLNVGDPSGGDAYDHSAIGPFSGYESGVYTSDPTASSGLNFVVKSNNGILHSSNFGSSFTSVIPKICPQGQFLSGISVTTSSTGMARVGATPICSGTFECLPGHIISKITLYADQYLNYVESIQCTFTGQAGPSTYDVHAGNLSDGGTRAEIYGPFTGFTSGVSTQAPSTSGLYFWRGSAKTATYGTQFTSQTDKLCSAGEYLSGISITPDVNNVFVTIVSPAICRTTSDTLCQNGGTYAGTPCLCINGFTGSLCETAPVPTPAPTVSCPEDTFYDNGACTSCGSGYSSPAGSTSIEACSRFGVTNCPTGYVISAISLRAGASIDYVKSITCTDGLTYYIRVGNSGGGGAATATGPFTSYTSGLWDDGTESTVGLFFTSSSGDSATYGNAGVIQLSTKSCGGGQFLSGLNVQALYKFSYGPLVLLGSSAICGGGTAAPTPSSTITDSPTSSPTATDAPTSSPTVTDSPTSSPTATDAPTASPTATDSPTSAPTQQTDAPTPVPSDTPAPTSTNAPTSAPSDAPTPVTDSPTHTPTSTPTEQTPTPTSTDAPTDSPTDAPTSTNAPTSTPTNAPTSQPTAAPTKTKKPTAAPTTHSPTSSPTNAPTSTEAPTAAPSATPKPTSSKCSSGFYVSSDGSCATCAASNQCKSYLTTSSTNPTICGCKTCNTGFLLDNKTCATCAAGYILNTGADGVTTCGACSKTTTHCDTFVTSPSCGCNTCAKGYFLQGTSCVQCLLSTYHCSAYIATPASDPTNICGCSGCKAGYYLPDSTSTTCATCDQNVYHCKTYLATTSTYTTTCGCKSCNTGTLSNGVCA